MHVVSRNPHVHFERKYRVLNISIQPNFLGIFHRGRKELCKDVDISKQIDDRNLHFGIGWFTCIGAKHKCH